MYQNRENVKNLILYLADILAVITSYVISSVVWLGYVRHMLNIKRADIFQHLGIMLFSFIVVIFIFNVNKDFIKRGYFEEFLYCFKINLIFAAFYAVILFVEGDTKTASRGVYFLTVILNVVLMLIAHILVKIYLNKVYRNKKKNVQLFLITTSDRAPVAIKQLEADPDYLNSIYGAAIIDINMVGEDIEGVPVRANFNSMLKYIKDEVIDEVFIDIPYESGNSLVKYIMELEDMGVVVHLNIEILENFVGFNKSFSMLGKIPVITFANNFYDTSKLMIKRFFDILGAIVGIAITMVITVFLAPILLLESRGPLVFKQRRVGRNGRYFNLYKFRSMYKDAEERKKALLEKNEMKGLMFKMSDDPRITKVGKFIRRTSIDELPQFFNVLKGDMSLVGTRPPTVDEFKKYQGYHKRRLSMKPGITGVWQVNGRNNVYDFEKVVKMDLMYIDNWSLGLDVKIILKTLKVVFSRSGAK